MWYVLWTATGKEEKTRWMINTYADPALYTRCAIPYRLKRHFFAGRSEIVKMILFPSYVFVETDRIGEFVKNISWFPGFNVILHTENFYSPIYTHEEYILTRLLNNDDIIDISEGYMEGDRVHITSGPLVGQEAHIKKVNSRKGIAVLEISLFDRKTEVCLGLEVITK